MSDSEDKFQENEQEEVIQRQKQLDEDFYWLKKSVDHEALTDDQIDTMKRYLLDIAVIGVFGDSDTPLDKFDTDCHDCPGGII